ncbi:hypothetical protein Tco_0670991 [Tanacetum coccineum]
MRRASKGYYEVVTPLFDTMLNQPQGEAPSLPSHPTSSSTPTTPPSTQHPHEAEEPATMPHDSPLHNRIEVLEKDLQQTKKTYSTAFTKLVLRVKKLENQLKSGKARKRARIVFSEDEEAAKDPFKQGRRIAQIDTNPTISLVQDEGTSWFHEHEKVHEKTSADTEVLVQEETPTELVEDVGSGGKDEKEVSTANVPVSTAGAEVSTASTDVSTAAASLVYIRKNAKKKKDKGKAIMTEPELEKKSKKQLKQERAVERISKKRTKNEAKTTKPDTEWKSMEKTKSRQSPSVKKSTKVNPDKSKVKK